jgi:hypothetical protein
MMWPILTKVQFKFIDYDSISTIWHDLGTIRNAPEDIFFSPYLDPNQRIYVSELGHRASHHARSSMGHSPRLAHLSHGSDHGRARKMHRHGTCLESTRQGGWRLLRNPGCVQFNFADHSVLSLRIALHQRYWRGEPIQTSRFIRECSHLCLDRRSRLTAPSHAGSYSFVVLGHPSHSGRHNPIHSLVSHIQGIPGDTVSPPVFPTRTSWFTLHYPHNVCLPRPSYHTQSWTSISRVRTHDTIFCNHVERSVCACALVESQGG